MDQLPAGFSPTAQQTGHALGCMTHDLCKRLRTTADTALLLQAQLTDTQYADELLLVTACAAIHAIEQSAPNVAAERALTQGFVQWVRELPAETRELLLTEIDEAGDLYADSAAQDAASSALATSASQGMGELELAVADRLFARGEDSETRGQACLLLAVVTPPLLWAHARDAAHRMLQQAGFARTGSCGPTP